MSVIADLIRAGVDPDLIAAVSDALVDAARERTPAKSSAAERQARYRDRVASRYVTNVTPVTVDARPAAVDAPPMRDKNSTPQEPSSLRSDAAGAASIDEEPTFQNAKQELWAIGKELLGELGVAPTKAGVLIGRWLKETGDDAPAVLDAIRRARQQKPVNAVSWIVRALPQSRGSPTRPTKTNSFLQAAADLTSELGSRDDRLDPDRLYLELSAAPPPS